MADNIYVYYRYLDVNDFVQIEKNSMVRKAVEMILKSEKLDYIRVRNVSVKINDTIVSQDTLLSNIVASEAPPLVLDLRKYCSQVDEIIRNPLVHIPRQSVETISKALDLPVSTYTFFWKDNNDQQIKNIGGSITDDQATQENLLIIKTKADKGKGKEEEDSNEQKYNALSRFFHLSGKKLSTMKTHVLSVLLTFCRWDISWKDGLAFIAPESEHASLQVPDTLVSPPSSVWESLLQFPLRLVRSPSSVWDSFPFKETECDAILANCKEERNYLNCYWNSVLIDFFCKYLRSFSLLGWEFGVGDKYIDFSFFIHAQSGINYPFFFLEAKNADCVGSLSEKLHPDFEKICEAAVVKLYDVLILAKEGMMTVADVNGITIHLALSVGFKINVMKLSAVYGEENGRWYYQLTCDKRFGYAKYRDRDGAKVFRDYIENDVYNSALRLSTLLKQIAAGSRRANGDVFPDPPRPYRDNPAQSRSSRNGTPDGSVPGKDEKSTNAGGNAQSSHTNTNSYAMVTSVVGGDTKKTLQNVSYPNEVDIVGELASVTGVVLDDESLDRTDLWICPHLGPYNGSLKGGRVVLVVKNKHRNNCYLFQEPLAILQYADCENIVDIYGYGGIVGAGVWAMVIESLDLPETEDTLEDAWRFISDVGNGLLAIHLKGNIHCDLKPSNVRFCASRRTWKIGDFDCHMSCSEALLLAPDSDGMGPGTDKYMAPEVSKLDKNVGFGTPSDMYSFGKTIQELFPQTTKEDSVLGGLVEKLLEFDPSERPTASQVLSMVPADLSVPSSPVSEATEEYSQQPTTPPKPEGKKVPCSNDHHSQIHAEVETN